MIQERLVIVPELIQILPYQQQFAMTTWTRVVCGSYRKRGRHYEAAVEEMETTFVHQQTQIANNVRVVFVIGIFSPQTEEDATVVLANLHVKVPLRVVIYWIQKHLVT